MSLLLVETINSKKLQISITIEEKNICLCCILCGLYTAVGAYDTALQSKCLRNFSTRAMAY